MSAQAAGAHTGVDGGAVHLQSEHAGGDGAGDGGGQRGRDPDPGIFHNVGHLKHGGAQALGDQTAPAVLLEGHDGEAHHLGTAAGHSSAARQSGQAQHRTDGGRGDGEGKGDAHQDGYGDPHPEGLELGGVVNDQAKGAGDGADGGSDELGQGHTDQNGDARGDQNIHLGLLAHHFAALRGDDGDDQNGQRAARSALSVGCPAHGGEREEDHGISL